jgi:hypothetical protein
VTSSSADPPTSTAIDGARARLSTRALRSPACVAPRFEVARVAWTRAAWCRAPPVADRRAWVSRRRWRRARRGAWASAAPRAAPMWQRARRSTLGRCALLDCGGAAVCVRVGVDLDRLLELAVAGEQAVLARRPDARRAR